MWLNKERKKEKRKKERKMIGIETNFKKQRVCEKTDYWAVPRDASELWSYYLSPIWHCENWKNKINEKLQILKNLEAQNLNILNSTNPNESESS